MTPEEQRRLHAEASTPDEAKQLLFARGMPELGNMAYTMMMYTTPISLPAYWKRLAERADRAQAGTAAFLTEKPTAQVAAALRWLAEVSERWLPKAAEGWSARKVAMDRAAESMGQGRRRGAQRHRGPQEQKATRRQALMVLTRYHQTW